VAAHVSYEARSDHLTVLTDLTDPVTFITEADGFACLKHAIVIDLTREDEQPLMLA
jgi:hypothetical protein